MNFEDQLKFAIEGYKSTCHALNGNGHSNVNIATDEVIRNEFKAWLTDPKKKLLSSSVYTLIAAPNQPLSSVSILAAAKQFGANQPNETYVFKALYQKYTGDQLSGRDPGGSNVILFSLVSNNFTPEIVGTVQEQVKKLNDLQIENPNIKVPSVLEGITFWYTLRALDRDLSHGWTAFNHTYIRYFNLPEELVDGWECVPYSVVRVDGTPFFYDSDSQYISVARLSIG